MTGQDSAATRPALASPIAESAAPPRSTVAGNHLHPQKAPGHCLATIPHVLTAHTSAINGLALRLIALEERAEKLATAAARAEAPSPSWRGALPSVPPSSIFATAQSIQVLAPQGVDGNTSLDELCLLMCLLKRTLAETIFEFGTFDGRTTLNLAANGAKNGRVISLDLPREQASATALPLAQGDTPYIEKADSGARYRGTPFEGRITQLFGDSAKFDLSPYAGTVDFVFIDASHAYEYVMNDSRAALRLLRGGKGAIAWHDYTPYWSGVVRALDELFATEARFAGLRHIEGTVLAYALFQ
jgi:predicted O-methyltransferase YrrM